MLAHLDLLLPSLFDALHAPSERVVVEALSVQAAIAADDPQQFRTLMQELIDRCLAACSSHSAAYGFRQLLQHHQSMRSNSFDCKECRWCNAYALICMLGHNPEDCQQDFHRKCAKSDAADPALTCALRWQLTSVLLGSTSVAMLRSLLAYSLA